MIENLRKQAENAKNMYNSGILSRQDAKVLIQPYLDCVNEKSKELAKKYNQKHKEITFTYYTR